MPQGRCLCLQRALILLSLPKKTAHSCLWVVNPWVNVSSGGTLFLQEGSASSRQRKIGSKEELFYHQTIIKHLYHCQMTTLKQQDLAPVQSRFPECSLSLAVL